MRNLFFAMAVLALGGCSSEISDAGFEKTRLIFDVDFNTEHNIIPMDSRAAGEDPGYFNFKMYSGQLAVLKQLPDGRYQVHRVLEPYGVKMEMDISAGGSELPVGMDIEGNFKWKDASEEVLVPGKMTVVHTRMVTSDGSRWCMFPTFAEKDVAVPTSPFFFTRFDDKSEVSVNFDIRRVYLTVSGEVKYAGSLKINDVRVRPDYITNVILKYDSQLNELSYSMDPADIEMVKNLWAENYPDVPFNYVEYN